MTCGGGGGGGGGDVFIPVSLSALLDVRLKERCDGAADVGVQRLVRRSVAQIQKAKLMGNRLFCFHHFPTLDQHQRNLSAADDDKRLV